MKTIYLIVSYITYYIGDLISKPMCANNNIGHHLYPTYNWFMLKSSKYQDLAGKGPWKEISANSSAG